MRELKFRIWDGTGFRGNLSRYLIDSETGEVTVRDWSDLYDEYYYTDGTNLVVQQYTGYHDKNEKEVYEGDIIKWNGPIVFQYAKFGFAHEEHPKWRDLSDVDWFNLEIIGNIFENPELIE